MTAFFIATVKVKDKEKFGEYGAKAAESFKPFGGAPVARGVLDGALLGAAPDANAIAVVSFPDLASLKSWFASPEYQALAPLRDAAADMTILACQAPS
ncbi:MAG: DUF1330 domain-containing protein [Neomegalonema sp.]|nr:DUF1330 domain-containing protein [Neomegalonema sp.]